MFHLTCQVQIYDNFKEINHDEWSTMCFLMPIEYHQVFTKVAIGMCKFHKLPASKKKKKCWKLRQRYIRMSNTAQTPLKAVEGTVSRGLESELAHTNTHIRLRNALILWHRVADLSKKYPKISPACQYGISIGCTIVASSSVLTGLYCERTSYLSAATTTTHAY